MAGPRMGDLLSRVMCPVRSPIFVVGRDVQCGDMSLRAPILGGPFAQTCRSASSYPVERDGSEPCCPIRGADGAWEGGTNLDRACPRALDPGGISQPWPGSAHRPPRLVVRRQAAITFCLFLDPFLRIAPLSRPALRPRRDVRRPAVHRSRRSATTPPAICARAPQP